MNVEKIRSGQGLDYKANPKPLGFVEDLKGNLTPVAVDAHAFSCLPCWRRTRAFWKLH